MDQLLKHRTDTAVASEPGEAASVAPAHIEGILIGLLVGLTEQGLPLVAYPGNPETAGAQAKTTKQLDAEDIGKEVALMFEGGDPGRPIVIGRLYHRIEHSSAETEPVPNKVVVDGERLLLQADKEIELKCGKASIILTRAGKVILRGTYLLNRSSGVNRIKGGSVQIN